MNHDCSFLCRCHGFCPWPSISGVGVQLPVSLCSLWGTVYGEGIKEHWGWTFSEFPSLGRAYNETIPAGTWTNVAAMEIHPIEYNKKTRFKHFECCIAMLQYRRVAHDEQCSKSKLSLDIPFWLVNWALTVTWWRIQVGSRTLCIKWKHNQGFDHCVGALSDAWHCLLWHYQFWSLRTWLLL